eukprot:3260939-Pleurochrysis_carterae.AAC.7
MSAEFVTIRRAADRGERPSGRARPRRTACSVGVRAWIKPDVIGPWCPGASSEVDAYPCACLKTKGVAVKALQAMADAPDFPLSSGLLALAGREEGSAETEKARELEAEEESRVRRRGKRKMELGRRRRIAGRDDRARRRCHPWNRGR